jgi:acyl-CoA synthetase (AMP-forming)/AMP-acid ligase II
MDSGDLARADADGFLWFFGRGKQVIVHDGSNVVPADVDVLVGVERGRALRRPGHLFVRRVVKDEGAAGQGAGQLRVGHVGGRARRG